MTETQVTITVVSNKIFAVADGLTYGVTLNAGNNYTASFQGTVIPYELNDDQSDIIIVKKISDGTVLSCNKTMISNPSFVEDSGTATTDASQLVTGILPDARLSANVATVSALSTVVVAERTAEATLANKTIDGSTNTLQNIPVSAIISSGTLAFNPTSSQSQALVPLGGNLKYWNWSLPMYPINPFTDSLGSTLMCFQYIYVDLAQTLTGARMLIDTAGSYTAAGYNGFCLYKVNPTTQALTLVANSANDGGIWKTAKGIVDRAFTNPYAATVGGYVIGAQYYNSAETTAPVMVAYNDLDQDLSLLQTQFLNNASLKGNIYVGNGSTPITSLAFAPTGADQSTFWFGIY